MYTFRQCLSRTKEGRKERKNTEKKKKIESLHYSSVQERAKQNTEKKIKALTQVFVNVVRQGRRDESAGRI